MDSHKRENGSATVFFLLVLTLILSFTFSLLEAARIHCLNRQTAISADLCIQSMFGNYNAALWDDYHLLFTDGAWQGEEFSIQKWETRAMEDAAANVKENHNLFLYSPAAVQVLEYELAADREGAVFRRQVSRQMKKEAASDAIQELLGIMKDGSSLEEEKNDAQDAWSKAWDAMSEAQEIEKEQKEEAENKKEQVQHESNIPGISNTEGQNGESNIENPMEYVKELKGAPILTAVLTDPSRLSTKSVKGPFLQDRSLESGNWQQSTEHGDMDRLFLQYFINRYFSNGAQESPHGPETRALSYEMEYMIGGKESDSENLEKVVYELLAVREAANFLTLMQDTGKKELALVIATAAVGFTGMVPLIKAVQIGILLAWAFVESILDLRALLDGKKVSLVKTPSEWNSDIRNCRKMVEDKKESETEEKGLSYGAYLQILLLVLSDQAITYRCMDVIEKNLRLTKGNENIHMDAMIAAVRAEVLYEANPLFWNLMFTQHGGWQEFTFAREVKLSY